ncbi:MAG: hypothetical protein KJ990_04260 [Proteobacteria bacterium]|nr:hypothetical protein [Pseudomonadota bacterium]MBU1648741.1 hypothetical protein [Pseudomonadota bacterium]
MRDKIVDLYSILKDNSQLDSYVQGYFGDSDSEVDLFRHKFRSLDSKSHFNSSDDIDDDDLEFLDLGE